MKRLFLLLVAIAIICALRGLSQGLAWLSTATKPAASGATTLDNNLVAYWKFDEESGTRVDDKGTNDLTDATTTSFQAGKQGNATDAVNDQLTAIPGPDFATGPGVDQSWAGWVKFDATGGASRFVLSRYNSGSDRRGFVLYYNGGSDRITVGTSVDGTSGTYVEQGATTFGSPATETWYFVFAFVSDTDDQIGISVNAGTVNTAAIGNGGSYNNTVDTIKFGSDMAGGNNLDGGMDEWGVWTRKLTADEVTELYNSGSGKTRPF